MIKALPLLAVYSAILFALNQVGWAPHSYEMIVGAFGFWLSLALGGYRT